MNGGGAEQDWKKSILLMKTTLSLSHLSKNAAFLMDFFVEEFVKSSDLTFHTQRIESTWFRVKRWLPLSGR